MRIAPDTTILFMFPPLIMFYMYAGARMHARICVCVCVYRCASRYFSYVIRADSFSPTVNFRHISLRINNRATVCTCASCSQELCRLVAIFSENVQKLMLCRMLIDYLTPATVVFPGFSSEHELVWIPKHTGCCACQDHPC